MWAANGTARAGGGSASPILGGQSLPIKKQKAKRGKAQATSGHGYSLAPPLPLSLSHSCPASTIHLLILALPCGF